MSNAITEWDDCQRDLAAAQARLLAVEPVVEAVRNAYDIGARLPLMIWEAMTTLLDAESAPAGDVWSELR